MAPICLLFFSIFPHTHTRNAHAQAPTDSDWPPPLTEGTYTHLQSTAPLLPFSHPSLAPKTRRNTINTEILIFLPLQLFSFPPLLSLPPPHCSSLFYTHHRIRLVRHHSTATTVFFHGFHAFRSALVIFVLALPSKRVHKLSSDESPCSRLVFATESDSAPETTLVPVQVLTPGKGLFDRLEKKQTQPRAARDTPTADLA